MDWPFHQLEIFVLKTNDNKISDNFSLLADGNVIAKQIDSRPDFYQVQKIKPTAVKSMQTSFLSDQGFWLITSTSIFDDSFEMLTKLHTELLFKFHML